MKHNTSIRTSHSAAPNRNRGWTFEILTDVKKLSDYNTMARRSRGSTKGPTKSKSNQPPANEVVETSAGFFSTWQIDNTLPKCPALLRLPSSPVHSQRFHSSTYHSKVPPSKLPGAQENFAHSRLGNTYQEKFKQDGIRKESMYQRTAQQVYSSMFSALVGEEEVNRIDQQYRASRSSSKSRSFISVEDILNI